MKITNISYNDLFKACQFYGQKEDHDYVYPAAITKLENNFGNAAIMADDISRSLSQLSELGHISYHL